MSLLGWLEVSDQTRGWIAVGLLFVGTPALVWGAVRFDQKLIQRKAEREAHEAARLKRAYDAGFAAAQTASEDGSASSGADHST